MNLQQVRYPHHVSSSPPAVRMFLIQVDFSEGEASETIHPIVLLKTSIGSVLSRKRSRDPHPEFPTMSEFVQNGWSFEYWFEETVAVYLDPDFGFLETEVKTTWEIGSNQASRLIIAGWPQGQDRKRFDLVIKELKEEIESKKVALTTG